MTRTLSRTYATLIVGTVSALVLAGLAFSIVRPAFRAKRALRLLAATQVGHTSAEEFRAMAARYGVRLNAVSDTFEVSERNRLLGYLHLAPPTVIGMNAKVSNGIISLVSVEAWVGVDREFATIFIHEFDTHQTGCGDVLVCIKPTSSTNTTTVFFVPGVPQTEREHLLSLNTWCLSKPGGCKSSRQFFPAAWERTVASARM